jgi:RNA polymerase sigma-70 factor (ECF subfamily)
VQDASVDETRELERDRDLERLYREQGDRMWRSVLAFAGDPEVASDAVAEAFAQALKRGGAIRDPERWLWRAAFRIAAGELKARPRHSIVTDSTVADEGIYEMEEPARDLVAALAKLSERQRASVVLHHAAGYPVKEIAAILGSTNAAVKVHLSRARKRLRELLEDGDG